jgi:hypothetical protein
VTFHVAAKAPRATIGAVSTIAWAPFAALGSRAARPARTSIPSIRSIPSRFAALIQACDHPAPSKHCTGKRNRHTLGIGGRDFHERVVLSQVDLPNALSRHSRLAGNGSDQVAGPHAVATTRSHEYACPATRGRCRDGRSGRSRRANDLGRPRALEKAKRSRSHLDAVVLIEERLQREELVRRNAAREHVAQLGAEGGDALASAPGCT